MRLIFVILFAPVLLLSQAWVQLNDFPGSRRDDGVAVIVNNKAFFGTGLQEGWTSTLDFYSLDLSTKTWSTPAPMPNGCERQYAQAFAGPNSFYVFGGDGPSGPLNNLYKYNLSTNTWSAMASKPGQGLIGPACFSFGNQIIIAGGKTGSVGVNSAEVWEYDINNNTWTQKNNFPFTPRWHACSAVLNGNGYLVFGQTPNDSCGTEFYKYTPATDSWQQLTNIPTQKGRSYARMERVNNQLALFGGVSCYGIHYKDLWFYNEATQVWSQNIDLPSYERRGGMSCSDGNHFYYACGYSPIVGRLKEVWMTDVPLGVEKNGAQVPIQMYPNPAKNTLHVSTGSLEKLDNLKITVSTSFGNQILLKPNRIVAVVNGLEIDISDLENGLYVLRIENGSTYFEATKLIVEH